MAGPATLAGPHTPRFFTNVLWGWLAVAVAIASGVLLSPVMIGNLGPDGYGIWILVFSLLEYANILGLGFRSAAIKYCAHYRALNQPKKINEIINTAAAYYLAVAAIVTAIVLAAAPSAPRWFRIPDERHADFSFLIAVAGVSWALGMFFNVFSSCLEGFQRFDLSSRLQLLVTGARTCLILALLTKGYGLRAIGVAVLFSQMLGYASGLINLRHAFPQLRFAREFVRLDVLRTMSGYGIHTFTAMVALQILAQGTVVIIGRFMSAAAVGYFALPSRLLLHASDAVTRVGRVTWSKTAEWSAHDRMDAIERLGAYTNRYCLALIMPLSIVMLVYGPEVLRVWVGADFASQSAPLVPAAVLGMTLSVVAQSSSVMILYGLGKHGAYSRSLLAEAILLLAGLALVLPRFGLLGAAWLCAGLAIANRGLLASWLLTRALHLRWTEYMLAVYGRPLAIAVPVFALAVFLKATLLPGGDLLELGGAAGVVGAAYYGPAFLFCVEREHRTAILATLLRRSDR